MNAAIVEAAQLTISDNTYLEIWTLLGPVVSAIGAALLTHALTRRRDRANVQLRLEEEAKIAARQIRRERLLDAYRALDASVPQRVQYKKVSEKEHQELIKRRTAAFTDVNLFGDEELAKQIEEIIENGQESDTSKIMNLLRDKLREQFELERTEARYKWVEVKLVTSGLPNDNEHEKESKDR